MVLVRSAGGDCVSIRTVYAYNTSSCRHRNTCRSVFELYFYFFAFLLVFGAIKSIARVRKLQTAPVERCPSFFRPN